MEWLEKYLADRQKNALLRVLQPIDWATGGKVYIEGKEYINCSSNDYLALAGHPRLLEESNRAAQKYGTSASAARLMSGDISLYHELEERVACLVNTEKALLFGCGYLANVGLMPALCNKADAIFSDRLNHASIIDGIMLSGARLFRFRHNNMDHLEALLKKERGKFKKALIITESLFSMDGDMSPLNAIVELKEKHNAMLAIDEAHAIGVFGPSGAGRAEELGITGRADIIIGTFGKALGSYGAFIGSSAKMIDYLINRARTFIYSTAPAPAAIGASLGAIEMLSAEPWRRNALLEKAALLRNMLNEHGLNVRGASQIVPVIVGEADQTIRIANRLKEEGVFAVALRPPTVTSNECRIRLSITHHHTDDDLHKISEKLAYAFRQSVLL
ncbi:MAG: 8-amino-7-oxononanoate synthase [Pseudomonadota bacterium]